MTPPPAWHRGAGDLATEVTMARLNFAGLFVIVEGPNDSKFWSARFSFQSQIVIGSGRLTVENAINLLDTSNFSGVVGIVDEDWDWATGYSPTSKNIVKSEPRDLEGIQFRSTALEKLICELSDIETQKKLEQAERLPLRDILLKKAQIFGRIHIVNALGRRVDLRGLKPQRFCDVTSWTYNEMNIKSVAVTLGVAPDIPSLERQMAAINSPDLWHICRGHDLVDVLLGGLSGVLKARENGRTRIEALLRSGVEKIELERSIVWTRFLYWCKANGWATT